VILVEVLPKKTKIREIGTERLIMAGVSSMRFTTKQNLELCWCVIQRWMISIKQLYMHDTTKIDLAFFNKSYLSSISTLDPHTSSLNTNSSLITVFPYEKMNHHLQKTRRNPFQVIMQDWHKPIQGKKRRSWERCFVCITSTCILLHELINRNIESNSMNSLSSNKEVAMIINNHSKKNQSCQPWYHR
jgi:hypothetical protein